MAGLSLTVSEREVAQATFGNKIKDLSEAELGMFVIQLIHKTYLKLGWKVDNESINLTLDEFIQDLLKHHGTITTQELTLAFKNGREKEYGDFFGLGDVTYFAWINSYSYGERRSKVIKAMLDAKENEGKEPEKKSPEEIDYIMKAACLKLFDEMRSGKSFIPLDAGNVKYKYLCRKGIIDKYFSDERKEEIRNRAEESLRERARGEGNPNQVKKAMDKITGLTVQSEAKRIALFTYFKEIIEIEAELSDILG